MQICRWDAQIAMVWNLRQPVRGFKAFNRDVPRCGNQL